MPPDASAHPRVARSFDILAHQLACHPQADCLAAKVAGDWQPLSISQVIAQSNQASLGLRAAGIGPGDNVAIISLNRPEWLVADFGIAQLGAVSVPMYPTLTTADYRYIFEEAQVKAVIVADQSLYDKVGAAVAGLGIAQECIFTFDPVPGACSFAQLLAAGSQAPMAELEPLRAAVQPGDLLTIIYTSGTTGKPKGVMLTHNNVLSNCRNAQRFMPVSKDDKALSFLPLCHIFERMVTYLFLINGVSIYYAENMDTIAANLREVRPNIFTTVPRLLEKMYDKIVAKGNEQVGLKKKLFFWALDLGLQYDNQRRHGLWYQAQLALANQLIFNKWREALGGNLRCVVSGAGALQLRLARVFWAARIRVMEGYGMTETSPVIAVGGFEPENNMIGTVGNVIDNTEVKIAPDGEILTRSASVMQGYYRQPALTAEVLDADGWMHTGDIGEMVAGRFLKITDRKKEMFKTSGGKYVAPQVLENRLKESPLIEQAMVVGEGQKFPAVLLVPAFDALQAWCAGHGVEFTTPAAMVYHPKVQQLYREVVEQFNRDFAQWEQLKKEILLPEQWSIESGEMTPKLSLKRKVIAANQQARIELLYQTVADLRS